MIVEVCSAQSFDARAVKNGAEVQILPSVSGYVDLGSLKIHVRSYATDIPAKGMQPKCNAQLWYATDCNASSRARSYMYPTLNLKMPQGIPRRSKARHECSHTR